MAKITITRLPNATPEYDANQFDQMISLLDQIILLLNTNYQQDIKEQLNEHNLDEPTVLGLADDIYLLDEIRALGLN